MEQSKTPPPYAESDVRVYPDNHRNATICSFSGLEVSPLALQVEHIRFVDVAHALSRKCRFTGHASPFMSVATHSVGVSRLVEIWGFDLMCQRWGLFHDAVEAYLPDIAAPIKKMIYVKVGDEMVPFRQHEDKLLRVIAERFRLSWPMPIEVKDADAELFKIEREEIMEANASRKWWNTYPPSEQARKAFLGAQWPDEGMKSFCDRFLEVGHE